MMSEESQHADYEKYRDTFLTNKKAALAGRWVNPEDRIRVSVWSGLASAPTILFIYRMLYVNGTVKENKVTVVPTTDRLVTVQDERPGMGILLDCYFISGTATVRRGEVYCQARLINGKEATEAAALCQGYVTSQSLVHMQDGKNENAVEGYGALRSITGTNPAAGAEVLETVPANARWKLRAIRVTFVAAAVVITRTIAITFDDGTTVFLRLEDRTGITTGQTRIANANVFAVLPADTATDHYFVLPYDLWLSQGYRIQTVTANIQGADDYGAPTLIVEEFLEE